MGKEVDGKIDGWDLPGGRERSGEGRRVGIDAATGVNGKVNERGKEGKGGKGNAI